MLRRCLLLAITVAVFLAAALSLVGWLWFLGTLVPMIGVVQVGTQAMADRYAYLPFIGLFIMVCWLMPIGPEQAHAPAMLLRAAVLSFWRSWLSLAIAKSDTGTITSLLWTHALDVTHDNWVAENNLGTAF